jgi:aspartyl/asparaginyl-tRNA synthetase
MKTIKVLQAFGMHENIITSKTNTNTMKTTIKITPDQVLALDKVLEASKFFEVQTPESRAVKSICYDCQDKVSKLAKKLKRSLDIFNNKKKHTINLKYHEAYALLEYLNHMLPFAGHNLDLQQVHDQLHQKLI